MTPRLRPPAALAAVAALILATVLATVLAWTLARTMGDARAPAGTATLAIVCGSGGQTLQLCREGSAAWAQRTGHRVEVVSTPASSTERLALYQQLLAAHADDIDVFMIDVVWPGILASHLIDLTPHLGDQAGRHFPAIIANNTVDGRLVGMPWFTDAGLLYYRKDLLDRHGARVPATWAELSRTAARIQAAERAAGNARMWGFVWQGRAYEGLTCDALEWVASHRGGAIVAPDGTITIRNPRARNALDMAAAWVDTISPPGVLNYAEEEARGVFQSGNAVFMRNWPYAWSLAQGEDSPVRGRVGVTRLPRGGEDGRHAATLGGWQLAVSRYSAQPALAADLVGYLTSPGEQKRRAIVGSFNPTLPELYEDPEVLAANPFMGELYATFRTAVARPSAVTGIKYNQVSSAFWNAVHRVLAGRMDADASLGELERTLERLSWGGRRW